MTRVDARSLSTVRIGLLASVAFGFVRDQIDTVAALARIVRRRPVYQADRRNEESW